MPTLKVPETLFTASTKTFSCQFLMDTYAGYRTDYFVRGLRCLPVRILNEVVANLIKKISICDPPYSKKISVTSVLISFMSEKLTHLDLSCFKNNEPNLFPDFHEEFLRVLPSLKNLLHLCLPCLVYVRNLNKCDDILCSIGKHCNLLMYLNINCNSVTDQALLCLIPSDDYRGCPELENLDIEYCSVAASTVAQLLEKLPNIRNIKYKKIEEALLLLKCNNNNFVLKLKSLSLHHSWYCLLDENCKICGMEETLWALCFSNLCPEIKSLSVCCNNKDFYMLKFFTKLTSVEIHFLDDDSPGVETIDYLTNYGTRLTSLKIHTKTFDSNLFLTIGKSCPTLRELTVTCWYLVNNLKFEHEEDKTLKVFTFLSSFSLAVFYRRENIMTPPSVLQLLKSTRSLTHLSIRCDSLIYDDEGFKEYWDMINTQSLLSVTISQFSNWMPYLGPTISTARLILESCPVLKKLGAFWNDREEIENLETSLKQSNYDVEIIYSPVG